MNYHWTIGQLKGRLNKLERRKKYLKNPNELKKIQDDILNLNIIINEFYLDTPKSSIKQNLNNYIYNFQDISYLINDLTNYYQRCLNPGFTLANLEKINITKDDIYDLTNDFYKDMGDIFYETFLKSYKDRQKHTRFIPKSSYSGQTLYLTTFKETFIESQYEQNLFDVITLIHEHGHDIHFRLNYDQQNSDNLLIFSELISTTFETIAYLYLESIKELKSNAIKALGVNETAYYADLKVTYNLIKIVDTYLKKSYSMEAFKKECKNFGLGAGELNFYLSNDFFPDVKYLVAKIIAIELRDIYLKDKDKFIYILKKIISLDLDDAESFYNKLKELGLKPLNNLDEYNLSLKKKLNL